MAQSAGTAEYAPPPTTNVYRVVQSAGAAEYTDCISVEG